MDYNNEQPWYCSWVAIIIAFILFWPVGIALIILRNTKDKQSVFLGSTSKKKYIAIGVILILIGLCSIGDSALMGLFFIAGGVALIIYAEKLKKKAQRNRQYIELIVNRDETSLDKIASITNVKYDILLKELQFLIDRNVLKGAILDPNNHTITVRKEAPARPALDYSQGNVSMVNKAAAEPIQITCVCPGCGAKHILYKGTATNCDYCDSPISAN